MHLKTGLGALAATGALLAFGAGTASASSTLKVDDDHAQCPDAAYTDIQSAVNAANPGDTVLVCPGTYTEQVTVPSGKDHINLISKNALQAHIVAPAVMTSPKAIVRVNGAQDVDIKAFTIEGPGGGPCDSLEYGVRVDGNGSANVEWNHITHIRDNPFGGCQNGIAVDAGRVSDAGVGSATVKYNAIDDYQKGGVVVSNSGSHGDVEFNKIVGAGPTPLIAQNGIQVSGGADAVVAANDVSGNVYSPQTVESTGVLVFGANSAFVGGNRVHDNDAGIVSFQNTGNVRVKGNWTWNSTYDGVEVTESSQIRVEDNNTWKNDEGIGLFASDHNVIDDNSADNNDTNGLFADTDTSRNTFTSNEASGNGSFDCRDDSHDSGTAGTANFWIGNTGNTSSPAGICRRARRW